MNGSDSLRLDEHLARVLAAYDQGFDGADGKAPTLDVPHVPDSHHPTPTPNPAERPVGPPSPEPVNVGSAGDLLPDSHPAGPFAPGRPPGGFPAPPRIGRFELRRQLGKGGCGIVFLAYDPKLMREVAVKIPRPEMLLNPDARRRLVREARAAAEFDHPNLVPVYETGEIGPVCYLATAFCPGQTLADWLDRQAFPVPVRQAARLVAQLAEAVQHAHDRGVLHRDLKPNNVILQELKADAADGGPPPGAVPLRGDYFVPRVVDFGLAKVPDAGPGDTATRQVLGTPKYMAPEQAQARHADIGPPADVYALGVILYELVAGRAPYDGPTDVDVLRQAVEGNLTPPRDLRPDAHRDLEAICLKAMARSPARRYRTAIDLADDLRRFLDGLPTLARPLNRVGRAARWLRRNDQAVAFAVVTTIAFVFLTIGLWSGVQTRNLRTGRDSLLAEQAERARQDRRREYARHVHDAFLSWRAGDAPQMAECLAYARMAGEADRDGADFAWGYLSGLGRVERLSLAAPGGATAAVAVAPAGPRLVTGHPDGTLAVWDRQTGARVGTAAAGPGAADHLGFVRGGAGLVTAGGDGPPRLWGFDPAGVPTPGPVLAGVDGGCTALAVSPDGARVYAGTAAGGCACWDAATGGLLRAWAVGGADPVAAVAVSPDGAAVATAGRAGPVRVWDVATGDPVAEVRGAAGATALAFLPAARAEWLLAAAGWEDGTVRLFAPDGREDKALPGHAGPVLALAADADGATLASAGQDAGVCVWDVSTGAVKSLLRGHDHPVRAVRFGPDGRVYTGSDDGTVKSWDPAADPEGGSARGLAAAVTGLAVRPDGPGFATAFADGSVEVYPHPGSLPAKRFPAGGRGRLTHLAYPADGHPVGVEVTADPAAAVVWEFGERPRAAFRAAASAGAAVTAVDFAAGPGRLVIGDDRGRVTVWSLAEQSSEPIAVFDTGLAGAVRHLCVSDDGRWVAAQTTTLLVGVWEVGQTRPAYRVPGHGAGLWLVRFLPGGDRLVTAGKGSSIKVWRVADGREDLSLLGHVGRLTEVAASPDGRTLVSGNMTGDVKLWDLRTGQELVGLKRHSGRVTAAEFGGDGRLLITGGHAPGGRGELAFWEAAKE